MAFNNFISSLLVYNSLDKVYESDFINSQRSFAKSIERERARVDRNAHEFSLITYEVDRSELNKPSNRKLLKLLPQRMRITDEAGWIDEQHVGVLLFSTKEQNARNFARQVEEIITAEDLSAPSYYIYTYPSSSNGPPTGGRRKEKSGQAKDRQASQENYPLSGCDIILTANYKMPKWKRLMDIVGAAMGLALLSPLFLLIGAFIKIVSPGPVFFKQERIGLGGRPFTFWKFRTMKVDVDTTAHQQLLHNLISDVSRDDSGKPMTKLDHDPQIIPCGKILRKSCIDELPQLFNVLLGDMSLIGPRPPIPYEVDAYDCWHTARLSVIPGMTGLWQVSGKNRLTFKEMVRLDISYNRKSSFWLDLKILFHTPRAIVNQVKDSY